MIFSGLPERIICGFAQGKIMGLPREVEGVVARSFIRRIYADETFTIAPCDGTRYIARVKGVMPPEYVIATKKRGTRTAAMNVCVYEAMLPARDQQLFNSLGSNIERVCLSQHQIIEFCEKNAARLLQKDVRVRCLFMKGTDFFVASLSLKENNLRVIISHREEGGNLGNWLKHLVVIPQLTP